MIIKTHPAASKNQVINSTNPDIDFEVYTTAPANEDKANKAVIKLLSKHLKVPKSQIIIIKGTKGKIKTLEILS